MGFLVVAVCNPPDLSNQADNRQASHLLRRERTLADDGWWPVSCRKSLVPPDAFQTLGVVRVDVVHGTT
jgi:hypothetical protein